MSEKTFQKELQRAYEKDRDALVASHNAKIEEDKRREEAQKKENERYELIDKIKKKYKVGTEVNILGKLGIISFYKTEYFSEGYKGMMIVSREIIVVTFLNKYTDLFYHESFNIEILFNLEKDVQDE